MELDGVLPGASAFGDAQDDALARRAHDLGQGPGCPGLAAQVPELALLVLATLCGRKPLKRGPRLKRDI